MIFPHDFYGCFKAIRHTTRLEALRKMFVFRAHACLYRIIIIIIIIIILINIITNIITSIICSNSFQFVLTFLFSNHSRILSNHILPTLGVGPTPVAITTLQKSSNLVSRHPQNILPLKVKYCFDMNIASGARATLRAKFQGAKKKQGRKGVGGALVNNFKASVCTYSFFDFVSPICFKWIETTK